MRPPREQFAVVARALREPWVVELSEDGEDQDDVVAYAGHLAMLTVGQPEYSPYVSLARSASRFAASVLRAGEDAQPDASGRAPIAS